MDWMFSTELWIALLTLATLEIVLSIDNLAFISIAVSRLPPEQRPLARRIGLAFACVTRILLLLSLVHLASKEHELFSLWGQDFSVRDMVLIGGGLFLLVKGIMEIHDTIEGHGADEGVGARPSTVFAYVIAQIAVIDVVFSLDSVITALGMVDNPWVMVTAILIALAVVIAAANPIGGFIDRHPSVRMLALAFIMLVGVALVADGFDFHIDRRFLYFAMAFTSGVLALSILSQRIKPRRA